MTGHVSSTPERRAPSPGLLVLGVVGAGATALALSGAVQALPGVQSAARVPVPPAARVMLVGCGLALLLAVALAPPNVGRRELLAAGLTALGALALLVAVADPFAVAALLLLLSAAHATRPGRRPFALRMRGPAFAALLLAFGWLLVRTPGPSVLGRVGALGLALALVAAAGLVPYLADFDAEEPMSASSLAWTAFIAPALALSMPVRVVPALTVEQGTVFAGTLIGLGLINLAWGTLGAWRTASDMAAWRYSFLADWGLVLLGLGLVQREALAAAYLALLGVVLVRLPLYLWARPSLLQGSLPRLEPLNVLVAILLAGSAPFSGFPVRLMLLHAATAFSWPLALALLVAMLLWIAHAFRLAGTISRPQGRQAVGVIVTLALSLALGLAPALFLRAAGL